ncbi:DNA recombination protein RmuC homolog [uncultured Desulfobacterium sp.]|uniref:DNA recombination protein RmuC homolog n=1 Tax=uncultured Desulfobacterium sp. TaxID=201089 RepID=A0A445MZG9_9BACT|nr:DNA recombination protein RmuC homolog [uncultured Desulfobacterium sp.]
MRDFLLTDILLYLCIALLAIVIALAFVILKRSKTEDNISVERAVREELRMGREESAKAARELREEVSLAHSSSSNTLVKAIGQMGKAQGDQLESIARRIQELTLSNENKIEVLRTAIDDQLKGLRDSNERKLDQIRETVDEKLQGTLEKRLGQSFNLVSERLEAVQRGLGEMQSLATGVGDLKRVLTNVKARGIWGEVQLGALLEQILAPDQYEKNVHTRKNSLESVEFAIKLPGNDYDPDTHVWLPIDSKFPQEDYLRLLDAVEAADTEAVQKATASLISAVNRSAKEIRDKYLNPPETTDFAIMFLPTEGLYAEILRQPGQLEKVQQQYRIVIAGPTTLSAILNSLRMGFRTLALEKRSSEVWKVLAAVKMEFGKFGEVLSRVKKHLHTASRTLDQTDLRTRAMERKLRSVEELPAEVCEGIMQFSDEVSDDETVKSEKSNEL